MWNQNIETFLGCDSDYESSRIVLWGAPFDSTTSYRPGTRFASKTMRSESYGLETYSPYEDLDLTEARVFDGGDLELPFGDTPEALKLIEKRTHIILCDKKFPFLIGGEHLVSLGAIRAAAKKWHNLAIIHFDAHTDLRDEYLGVRLSHASVIRRAWEIVGDGNIYQFGIRSGAKEEWRWANEGHTKLTPFDFSTLSEAITDLKNRPVYFTVDLDILDPAYFSGTGTPEPGGVTFLDLLSAIRKVLKTVNVVACDLVELSPILDASGTSTVVALKLLREMLLCLEKPFVKGPSGVKII